MLLRNVALLLLCTSVAMSAALGHYLVPTKEVEEETTVEEEAPVLNLAAVSDGVVEAASVDAAEEDVAAAAVEPEDDAPAAEERLAVDQPAADNKEVDVLIVDDATAEEPGAEGDVPAGDTHAVEALTEEVVTQEQPPLRDDTPVKALAEEALTQEQAPSEDDTPVEALIEEALTQEQPPSEDDTPVEALIEEALTQEQPPSEDDTPVEALTEEVVNQEQPPSEEDTAVEALAEEVVNQEQPPSEDAIAVEALAEEALTQEQPPPEEEGNEIAPVQTKPSLDRPSANEDESSWGFNSIRSSFQSMHGYFDSLVELVGGRDGVCQYRCRHGDPPQPRAGYQMPEPNGCSSSLVGFQLDLGVPVMTKCCDQHDLCYDTCGTSKLDCDAEFRSCLLNICSDLRKSLGFVSQVQACDSMADVLHNTVGTLGCRPYMNSQRAACVCEDEERDEL
ncbi:group XIIB secretory phospholipase A2-like protein isoform X2 [Limanda limanda]|uniref:group XIIB secretory phospholipase A2-like protein isoform X2 n=1 Tax=Limanda limanda TaxID=27771 RepID=UPI0029C82494|nr:group XIIB secretory phospholipase A2-like protein isoform X2 [Limanda limanda]